MRQIETLKAKLEAYEKDASDDSKAAADKAAEVSKELEETKQAKAKAEKELEDTKEQLEAEQQAQLEAAQQALSDANAELEQQQVRHSMPLQPVWSSGGAADSAVVCLREPLAKQPPSVAALLLPSGRNRVGHSSSIKGGHW